MPAMEKFHAFPLDLINGEHDFNGDTFKLYATNVQPAAATHAVKADLAEIAAGGGYPAGGLVAPLTTTTLTGLARVLMTDVTLTATGAVGPFRWWVLYNDTSLNDRLIGWFTYREAITLGAGETFVLDASPTLGIMTLT